MRLNKVDVAAAEFILNFCESRILTEVGNMKMGVGNPIEELDRIYRVMSAVVRFTPCDAPESVKAEAPKPAKDKKAA